MTRDRHRGWHLEGVIWCLRLECGHRVERTTYTKPGWSHPKLKRAKCIECMTQ